MALLVFVVPRFEVIFKDFGLSMSWLMRLIVRASNLLFIVVPLVAILLSADKFVLDALSGREDDRGMSLLWTVLMLWIPLLVIALMVGSIGFAMTHLTSRLNG